MTTIIAEQDSTGIITFAWDSQTSWLGRGMNGRAKVVSNGPATFGTAGSARGGDILKHMSIPSRHTDAPGYSDEAWIVTRLAPAIVKAFREVEAADSGEFAADTHVILAVGNTLGYLSGNLSFVQDDRNIYGVGSGADYAIGALEAGASLEDAVKVAIKWDLGSGGEVQVRSLDPETRNSATKAKPKKGKKKSKKEKK